MTPGNEVCAKAVQMAIWSAAVFLLALGAVGTWAFSETMTLHQAVNDNRVALRQAIEHIDRRITLLHSKDCH